MRNLIVCLIITFAVISCGINQWASSSPDSAANAFVSAVLAGNENEAAKFLATNSPQDLARFRGSVIAITSGFEINGVNVESVLESTPSPADKLNGFGDQYYYRAKFAFRQKDSATKWQDGCIWFRIHSDGGKWLVIAFSNVNVPDFLGNKSTECTSHSGNE